LAKVVWTAEAEHWLRRIHDYIARDKPAAAFGIVESLYKRAEILAQFPEIARPYDALGSRSADNALGSLPDRLPPTRVG
jgi:plasmid stabilization system protein ParE